MEWLNRRFSDQLISRKCDPQWAPYSPDLNSSDFYLWWYFKDRVYVHNLQSIPDLKKEIKKTIKAIPSEECKKIIDSFVSRIQVYLQRQRAYFEEMFLSSNKSKHFKSVDLVFFYFFRTKHIIYVREIL